MTENSISAGQDESVQRLIPNPRGHSVVSHGLDRQADRFLEGVLGAGAQGGHGGPRPIVG